MVKFITFFKVTIFLWVSAVYVCPLSSTLPLIYYRTMRLWEGDGVGCLLVCERQTDWICEKHCQQPPNDTVAYVFHSSFSCWVCLRLRRTHSLWCDSIHFECDHQRWCFVVKIMNFYLAPLRRWIVSLPRRMMDMWGPLQRCLPLGLIYLYFRTRKHMKTLQTHQFYRKCM